MIRYVMGMVLLTIVTGCTQPPAQVVVLGSGNYSRAEGGYHSSAGYHDGTGVSARADTTPAPISYGAEMSQGTQQTAATQPIIVNDLSVPPASPPLADTNTIQVTDAPPPAVNPWTNKPRDGDTVSSSTDAAKPFIWPLESTDVSSQFGPKSTGKANEGINIAASTGAPVWAAADGEIVYADNTLKGYGNMVLIKHKGGRTTTYAHLSKRVVEKYDRVKQGDIIGYVGATGNVKGSQLYFAVREGAEAVDPLVLTSKP